MQSPILQKSCVDSLFHNSKGNGATGLAISLLGAMVMSYNLFLHSALVFSSKILRSVRGIKEACRLYMIESSFALMVAFFINVYVISISDAVCSSSNLSPDDQESCKDLDLNKASFLLRNVLDGIDYLMTVVLHKQSWSPESKKTQPPFLHGMITLLAHNGRRATQSRY